MLPSKTGCRLFKRPLLSTRADAANRSGINCCKCWASVCCITEFRESKRNSVCMKCSCASSSLASSQKAKTSIMWANYEQIINSGSKDSRSRWNGQEKAFGNTQIYEFVLYKMIIAAFMCAFDCADLTCLYILTILLCSSAGFNELWRPAGRQGTFGQQEPGGTMIGVDDRISTFLGRSRLPSPASLREAEWRM